MRREARVCRATPRLSLSVYVELCIYVQLYAVCVHGRPYNVEELADPMAPPKRAAWK